MQNELRCALKKEAACYFEKYLLTILHSHDNRQVEGRLYSHNNRWVEWRLQYMAVMLVTTKEIRLECTKQKKQLLDIYLIPPVSEIHNWIRPINVWQVAINITGFVVVYIKWMCFVVWLPSYPVSYSAIQGDSGEKVNIFGGGSIDHCERKSSYEHVSNSDWLQRHSFLNLQVQKHYEW
jgi:hypothetical protein